MNEALLKSLQDLAKQAADLETETAAAVKFLDADVNESRREKEVKICEFLDGMMKMLAAVDYPRNRSVTALCCGTHWEGKPGACGSHCRNNGVDISRRGVHFGRYFSGVGTVDDYLRYIPAENRLSDGYSDEYRNNIVDRWNSDCERHIEQAVANAAKQYIEERMKKATENLRAANECYENYFGRAES